MKKYKEVYIGTVPVNFVIKMITSCRSDILSFSIPQDEWVRHYTKYLFNNGILKEKDYKVSKFEFRETSKDGFRDIVALYEEPVLNKIKILLFSDWNRDARNTLNFLKNNLTHVNYEGEKYPVVEIYTKEEKLIPEFGQDYTAIYASFKVEETDDESAKSRIESTKRALDRARKYIEDHRKECVEKFMDDLREASVVEEGKCVRTTTFDDFTRNINVTYSAQNNFRSIPANNQDLLQKYGCKTSNKSVVERKYINNSPYMHEDINEMIKKGYNIISQEPITKTTDVGFKITYKKKEGK